MKNAVYSLLVSSLPLQFHAGVSAVRAMLLNTLWSPRMLMTGPSSAPMPFVFPS